MKKTKITDEVTEEVTPVEEALESPAEKLVKSKAFKNMKERLSNDTEERILVMPKDTLKDLIELNSEKESILSGKLKATGEFYAYTADSKTYAIVAPDGRLISPFSYDQITAEETARRFNRKNR